MKHGSRLMATTDYTKFLIVGEFAARQRSWLKVQWMGLLSAKRCAKRSFSSPQGISGIVWSVLLAAAIKKLTMYRQDWYLRHAESNPKIASVDIFALKQPCNGGWTDKQVTESSGTMALNVSISGASGAAFDAPGSPDKADK